VAFGNQDANRAQLRDHAGHRDLPLMVLRQHEAAQARSEMAPDLGRQRRRDGLPVRGAPALALEAHDLGPQHEILDEKARIALESRIGRRRGLDHALLVDGQIGTLGTPPAAPAAAVRLFGRGGLFHAARLDLRPALEAFQPGNLVALRRDQALQLRDPGDQRDHQRLQLGLRESIDVRGQHHAESESKIPQAENPHRPDFCPSYCPSSHTWDSHMALRIWPGPGKIRTPASGHLRQRTPTDLLPASKARRSLSQSASAQPR
jgi:hypothetical protein